MYINTFKYTPADVDCKLCTEYVKKFGCTACGCPWMAERIAAQLVSEYWVEHKRDIHIRPTFSLTGQPPRMCRSCWDILM